MSVKPILKMGDLRLLRQARPVTRFDTPELDELIEDMFETMHAANGAGLAAPQIGVNLQVAVFGFDPDENPEGAVEIPKTVLINPKMEPVGDDVVEAWEGCLSVPGMNGVVPRWAKIRYEGFDQKGNPVSAEVDGSHARVAQHEFDHLLGMVYPMRMPDLTRFGFSDALFPWAEPQEDELMELAESE